MANQTTYPSGVSSVDPRTGLRGPFTGGVADFTSLAVNTVDIDGGTIDGTIIGGSSAAAITGTTGSFSSTFEIGGNTIVGSTTVTPDGTLHVHTASAGVVTASASADDLVVEGSGATGISILAADNVETAIRFGSVSDDGGLLLDWHFDNSLGRVRTGKVGASLELAGDNAVTNLTLSGASGSELAAFSGRITTEGTNTFNDSSGNLQLDLTANNSVIINCTTGVAEQTVLRSDKSLRFDTNGGTEGLSINTSQNATFAGDVTMSEGKISITDTAAGTVLDAVNSNASPLGMLIDYSAASPNGTGNLAIEFTDSTTQRFAVRSNGGIANFQSNDVDLSDERVKEDVQQIGSTWDKIKNIEVVQYKYKGDERMNTGIVAQQIEKIMPESIDNSDSLKRVHNKDLYFSAIKALQEALQRIEFLEESLKTP